MFYNLIFFKFNKLCTTFIHTMNQQLNALYGNSIPHKIRNNKTVESKKMLLVNLLV